LAALIDSGADTTQVPDAIAEELGLARISDTILIGPFGEEAPALVYVAETIVVAGVTFEYVEVVGAPSDDVLIGRNVLGQVLTTLHGPRREFELVRPDP
jgi:hypothetical protein